DRVVAEEVVLAEHQRLAPDAVVRRGEPVVPDERHALDERARRAGHAVEPPAVVVAPGVARRQGAALVVVRLRPDELLRPRLDQGPDSPVEALLRERLGFAGARPETGAPEQPLGLRRSEGPPI